MSHDHSGTPPRAGGGPVPPVCPRHPHREAYVLCQRCERPTCPECQRPAAVGVQCVDCVRAAARTAPVVRTAFGGRLTGGVPWVTRGIVVICAVVFLLDWSGVLPLTYWWAFYPVLVEPEPWRLVTAAFLHSTGFLPHILFNMYALWITGPTLERVLGRWRFVTLYLVCAVGGSVGSLVLAPLTTDGLFTGTVGASGAVFGLWGAMLAVQKRFGGDVRPLLGMIAVNAVIGFMASGIAWQAHLGGLVTGLVLSFAWSKIPPGRRGEWHVATALGLVVLLVAATVVKVSMINAFLAVG